MSPRPAGPALSALLLALAALLAPALALKIPGPPSGKRPNVLYLLSDDMRADWGAYGMPVHTPNLDHLATKSLLFRRAYCQLSVCSPSRMSFMSSRRPDTFQVWNFIDAVPLNATSAPHTFKEAGYLALGLGKTYHENSGAWDADFHWSTDVLPYFPYESGTCPHGNEGGGHCVQNETEIYDYHLRVQTLKYLAYALNNTETTGQPFFLAAGFRKPHAPWQSTQEMYDLYNTDDIRTATVDTFPPNSPLIAWSQQLRVALENGTSFPYSPFSPVPKWVQQDQRHGYYASLSYVDQNVGFILDLLNKSGQADNTIIVFHADHGYHLGEHGEWEKKSNFDLVVRVPLMIHVPWLTTSHNKSTMSLTELIDVFPTMVSLAGLPVPPEVEGTDLSPLLLDPTKSLKDAAYHQYPACNTRSFNSTRDACNNTPKDQFDYFGYSVRTDQWRYTAWFKWDTQTLKADFDGDFVAELYNHAGDNSTDMDSWENINLVDKEPAVASQLHAQLVNFFQKH